MASGDSLMWFDPVAARPTTADPARLDWRNSGAVLEFAESVDEQADFLGALPKHYSGNGIDVRIVWACDTAVTGNARWAVEFERRRSAGVPPDVYDLDVDDFGSPISVTSAAPTASGVLTEWTVAIPALQVGSDAAGELFRLRVSRVGTDPLDTILGDTQLVAITLSES